MKGEYIIVLEETRQAIDNLFSVVEVDDTFPEYVDCLKASMSGCLMKLYALCQGKAYRQKKWKDLRDIYDKFAEMADVAWTAYVTSRGNKWAFKSKVRFDGHKMKSCLYLPKENTELCLQELKNAIFLLQSQELNKPEDAEWVRKTSSYFHKAYLFIRNSNNQKKLSQSMPLERFKNICSLSQQYEQQCKIFLSQSVFTDKQELSTRFSVSLQGYIKDFQRMTRAKLKGETAPHKVILLLAILDLIEQKGGKLIPSEQLYDCIPFGYGLDVYFMKEWTMYVHSTTFKPALENPLIHMASEPFYSLKLKHGAEAATTHTLSAIRKSYIGITLEDNLITLMLNTVARVRLRTTLIKMLK